MLFAYVDGKIDLIFFLVVKQILTAWDNEKEEWYFSIVDIIAALTAERKINMTVMSELTCFTAVKEELE